MNKIMRGRNTHTLEQGEHVHGHEAQGEGRHQGTHALGRRDLLGVGSKRVNWCVDHCISCITDRRIQRPVHSYLGDKRIKL